METIINTRIQHKHDVESKWQSSQLIPLIGEFIVYDIDEQHSVPRLKIGDGKTVVNDLPFIETQTPTVTPTEDIDSTKVIHNSMLLYDILENYVLSIDYEKLLAFDITTLVFDTSSVLDYAVLDTMILG